MTEPVNVASRRILFPFSYIHVNNRRKAGLLQTCNLCVFEIHLILQSRRGLLQHDDHRPMQPHSTDCRDDEEDEESGLQRPRQFQNSGEHERQEESAQCAEHDECVVISVQQEMTRVFSPLESQDQQKL